MVTEAGLSEFQRNLAALNETVGQLCGLDIETEEFFRLFLERTVAVLGVGGGIWQVKSGQGGAACMCHMNLSVAGLEEGGRRYQLLARALSKVVENAKPIVLSGKDGSNIYDGGLGAEGANDLPNALLFVPLVVEKAVAAVLVLIAPAEVDARAVSGYLGFVMGLCERAGFFLLRRQMRAQIQQAQRSNRLHDYVSALHSNLDPKRACYALANYAQELLGVYRCMAGTYNSRGKFRMEAVSGLEAVAVKSSFIQSISEVAREVCRNEKPLMVENPNAAITDDKGDHDDLVTASRLYMLQAESLVLGVFPIKHEGHVVGALVVEKTTEESFDQEQRQQIEELLAEAGAALDNSLKYRNLPLSHFVRALGAVRDKVYRMDKLRRLMWAAAVVAVLAMPFIWHKQVKVMGTAELVPMAGRFVYAQQDGMVEMVSIPPERKVQKGDVLAVMDRRAIEGEIDRVRSSIEESKLAQREALKMGQSTHAERYGLAIKALQAELTKYQLQREQYELIAPVTGSVITRDSEIRQLLLKPISRGEAVLEVVPDDTPWEFTVNVPEDEAGALLKAYEQLEPGEALNAKLILNAYPNMKFETVVISLAPKANVLTTGEQKYRNVISVRLAEPKDLKSKIIPRQGIEGKAAIECGRHTIFYVITREFADFLRINMF